MLSFVKRDAKAKIAVGIFLFFTALWVVIQLPQYKESNFSVIFGSWYGVMALWGGLWGLKIAHKWGGFKSILGRSILMFSVGLLLQEFGQLAYFYYVFILKIEVPYPSLGDIGYFGSIPFYIYGVMLLAKASGVRFGMKTVLHKLQAILLPLGMLAVGYYLFLKDYDFTGAQALTVFLDFGYPLGQAIYVSIAFLTYLLSRRVLGGVMRDKILLILFALLLQYTADYTFLYQVQQGTWRAGEINEFMYLFTYFVMTVAIFRLDKVFDKLSE